MEANNGELPGYNTIQSLEYLDMVFNETLRFHPAIGVGTNHPARGKALVKRRIFGIEICLGLFLSIQVVEIAKELVESMIAWKKLVFVTQMILPELTGYITVGLE